MTRTVLVTGGAGFIGSAVALRLAAAGDRVRVIDDLSAGSRAYLAGIDVDFIVAPVEVGDRLTDALKGVDAVIHLAAKASIPDSIADPLGNLEANVTQTVHLLDAARRAGVGRFLLASSNAVMGTGIPPFDETMRPHPTSPYGASKLAGEAYCQAYAATYGIAAAALRFSNVYGPRSLHKRSVGASWVRAALDGEPVVIYGSGEQTRDYIYVDDVAEGITTALDAPPERVAGETFQLGTGVETSLNDLAQAVVRAVGKPLEIRHAPARAGDVGRNSSAVEKAARQLGFRARTGIDSGLARMIAWYEMARADPALASIRPLADSGSE